MTIEQFSLLRHLPITASATANATTPKSLRNTLYALIDRIPENDRKRTIFRALDSSTHRDYNLHHYERYKAGLLGRVWFKKVGKVSENNANAQADNEKIILISDQDALGLKWKAITQEEQELKD